MKKTKKEVLSGVSSAEVTQLVADYQSKGWRVKQEKEKGKDTWKVVATKKVDV